MQLGDGTSGPIPGASTVGELEFVVDHSGVLTKDVTGAGFSPSYLGKGLLATSSLLNFEFPVEAFQQSEFNNAKCVAFNNT